VQRSSSGRIVGALAVSAPETRMTEERTGEVLAALRRVSAEAQRRLP
jgi:DNA-binding IclR family transcriptional regulator